MFLISFVRIPLSFFTPLIIFHKAHNSKHSIIIAINWLYAKWMKLCQLAGWIDWLDRLGDRLPLTGTKKLLCSHNNFLLNLIHTTFIHTTTTYLVALHYKPFFYSPMFIKHLCIFLPVRYNILKFQMHVPHNSCLLTQTWITLWMHLILAQKFNQLTISIWFGFLCSIFTVRPCVIVSVQAVSRPGGSIDLFITPQ